MGGYIFLLRVQTVQLRIVFFPESQKNHCHRLMIQPTCRSKAGLGLISDWNTIDATLKSWSFSAMPLSIASFKILLITHLFSNIFGPTAVKLKYRSEKAVNSTLPIPAPMPLPLYSIFLGSI